MQATLHAPASSRLLILIFIGWRNIWRSPVRSMLTVAALSGSLVVVILYSALMEGMSRQMVQFATEISTGHIQVHRQAFIDDQDLYAALPWSYMQKIEQKFPAIHVAPRLYAAGLASSADNSTGVLIKAVDPQRETAVTKMLEHVRQGKPDLGVADTTANGLTRYNLVIGAQLAKNMKVVPGSELVLVTQAADGSIGNALYRIAAVLKPLEPGFDRMGVLMSIEAFQQLMYLHEGFHELAIKVDDSTRLEAVQRALDEHLRVLLEAEPLDELGGGPVVRNWRQLTPAIADMLEMSSSIILIIGFIVISLASLGMLNTMLMAVHERTHEFGILLAIGMKRRWLLLMVLLESLFLALVAALAGSLTGTLIAGYFERHGIDFSHYMPDGYDWAGIVFEPVMKGYLEPMHVVNGSVLMILITMLASLLPAWRVVRLKPAEVMQ
ncbi:MAG: FtsX-like permease family protein [Mariprofundaceae bacterium]|nr:FtsX-like permease family protein [Mariprofundaceae bacterium]